MISIHPAVSHLAHLVPRLLQLVAMVESGSLEWVQNLESVRPRFRHGDLHFGNLLYNPESGEIVSVIDWEFSAAGVRALLIAQSSYFQSFIEQLTSYDIVAGPFLQILLATPINTPRPRPFA